MRKHSIQDYTVALTILYLFVAAAYSVEPSGMVPVMALMPCAALDPGSLFPFHSATWT